MINLYQLKSALNDLGVNCCLLLDAIDALNELKAQLDTVPVSGRENVDKMLGCMMAIDIIIGKGEDNG